MTALPSRSERSRKGAPTEVSPSTVYPDSQSRENRILPRARWHRYTPRQAVRVGESCRSGKFVARLLSCRDTLATVAFAVGGDRSPVGRREGRPITTSATPQSGHHSAPDVTR